MVQQETGSIRIEGRRRLTAGGVTEVMSFEENLAVLATADGTLLIQGEGLELKGLAPESGQAIVEGTIGAVSYGELPKTDGWLRRLFR